MVFYRPMTHASIEGAIARVERRGKSLFCFEGTELRKIGHGELIRVDVDGTRYVGELVAIGPTRAIVFISGSVADHGILPLTATVPVA